MTPKLILASQSPRRSDLLQRAGYSFIVKSFEVEEIYPDGLQPLEVAAYLAELKSKNAIENLEKDEVVLTADTIVVFDRQILGKPKDRSDAVNTLTTLSGQKHKVITAISIASSFKFITKTENSWVKFSDLSRPEILFYVDRFQPFDKAGSYGIQDWIGLCKIEKIEGSYTNIMGLPMELAYRMLGGFGIYPQGLLDQ